MALPPINQNTYNQKLYGLAGEFGKGDNAQIFYLQTGISPPDLDKITLISDIPGSQTWSVRDLFQRDVDIDRVTNSILPYFEDPNKLKFFNPLTLTMIPRDSEDDLLKGDSVPFLEWVDKELVEEGQPYNYRVLEIEGLFRFRYPEGQAAYGMIEWNDRKINIVAIDGQHRLSALKRLHADNLARGEDVSGFSKWTIPAVIFSVRSLNAEGSEQHILNVIRNVFVYINTEAHTPSLTRQVLLNDESVLAVSTQEVLEYSHSNDVKPDNERDTSRLPLLCFDWRGHQKNQENVINTPGALISVPELRLWLEAYIIGDDNSARQEEAFDITPIDLLKKYYVTNPPSISSGDSKIFRERFRGKILPGISVLLNKFAPYQAYIEKIREIESEYNAQGDIPRAAFHKLRFGDDPSHNTLRQEVEDVKDDIVHDLMDCQMELIPELFRKDIGMRGVVSAFGEMKKYFQVETDNDFSWLDYSNWYVTNVNNLVSANIWFNTSDTDKKGYLKHIVYDHNDRIINYRAEDVKKSFSIYMIFLVLGSAHKNGEIGPELWAKESPEIFEKLFDTVEKGNVREARVLLKDDYSDKPPGELTDASKEKGKEMANKWKETFLKAVKNNIGVEVTY